MTVRPGQVWKSTAAGRYARVQAADESYAYLTRCGFDGNTHGNVQRSRVRLTAAGKLPGYLLILDAEEEPANLLDHVITDVDDEPADVVTIAPAGNTRAPAVPDRHDDLDSDEQRTRARRVEDRRRAALDTQLRRLTDARADTSPYDLLGDALVATVTDAVHDAIHRPDFAQALARRGYVIAPALPDGDIPEPATEWLHDGIDLVGAGGDWTDPLGRLDELWSTAYRAGWSAARADQAPQ